MLYWSELTDVTLDGNREYERNLQRYRIKSLYGNKQEEPLPEGGSCLLGSLNLAAFVHTNEQGNTYFDFDELAEATYNAVVGLNEVLDEGLPLHPLQEQRDSVRDWRQIGLGVMGIADMLIKLEIKYGSDEAIQLCDCIAYNILNNAIYSSCALAAVDGPFPKYDYDSLVKSKFYRDNVSEQNKAIIKKYGLRNSQLLTIAPTGTLSTMLGISGGIEPIFANYYTRKTESLYGVDKYYKVYTPIVKDYMESHNITDDKDLPDYFVVANDLHYTNRIAMQAVWQKYIDASISSTINLSESTTVEEVMKIYYEAWRQGLKGITVFRNNCRRAAILSTDDKKDKPEEKKTVEPTNWPVVYDSIQPISRKTIGTTHGNTYCRQSACGTLYITVNCDDDGNVVETFVESSKGGICKANIAAVNRLISLSMRAGVKVEEIIDQLKGIDCPACSKTSKPIDGLSCPDIIGRVVRTFYYGEEEESNKKLVQSKKATQLKAVVETPTEIHDDKCPECGATIRREGGCVICVECGWSRCG